MNKHLNTVQDVSFRIMSIECFLTRNLCIRMVVLYLVIVNDNRKSTTYDLVVNNCNNLPLRKILINFFIWA